MSRRIRSHLDLIYPDVTGRARSLVSLSSSRNQREVRKFQIGDEVYARDLRTNKLSWIPGKIIGPVSYRIQVEDKTIRRHVDHLQEGTRESVKPNLIPAESTLESAPDLTDVIPIEVPTNSGGLGSCEPVSDGGSAS